MHSKVVLRVMSPSAVVASKVWYLNNPSRLLLCEGKILNWQYCDAVFCGNDGATSCHGCSNWQEIRNNSNEARK